MVWIGDVLPPIFKATDVEVDPTILVEVSSGNPPGTRSRQPLELEFFEGRRAVIEEQALTGTREEIKITITIKVHQDAIWKLRSRPEPIA
jgi:hypothetical protein